MTYNTSYILKGVMNMIKSFYTKNEEKNKRAVYYSSYYCNSVIEYMKDYVKEERQNIDHIDSKTKDFVLMDLVCELGKKSGIEIPFNPQALHELHNYDNYIKPRELGYLLKNMYNSYVEHLLDSKKVLKENRISIIDSLFVLSDFLNYTYEKDEEKERLNRQNNKIYGKAL